MKKFLLVLGMIIGLSAAASAKDTYTHDASVLPEAARTTLADNFKSDISVIKVDKNLGRVSEYEVILVDGTEISFDRGGKWENVETSNAGSVPSWMIPKAIADHVAKSQPGVNIVGIEKEHGGYDIELANGVEMRFDKNGNFRHYDD